MIRSWLTIAIAAVLLVGCAEGTSEKESDTTETQEENAGAVNPNDAGDPQVVLPQTAAPTADQGQAQTAAPASGLNPPHGEPGHDCDLPVGAPLDGSGTQNTSASVPSIMQQPAAQQPASQPSAKGAPANGINPPHGEPGHDCAVAVGAPLPAK